MYLQYLKAPAMYGIFLSVSLSFFVLYIVGASRYLTNHDENTCDMTYMFEYPQYVVSIITKYNVNLLFFT